ncbi:hypothetical protein KUTeg_014094 [Tegillarca granosa]|uniref:Uncharacterized protein n=1 Tax=Tegillarca granosa TaxID=220873 RepID=A0ABQ9EZF1_TEGGR|nr:hypothetical protein KUTeg_014094 [Tegillarca granosa]
MTNTTLISGEEENINAKTQSNRYTMTGAHFGSLSIDNKKNVYLIDSVICTTWFGTILTNYGSKL